MRRRALLAGTALALVGRTSWAANIIFAGPHPLALGPGAGNIATAGSSLPATPLSSAAIVWTGALGTPNNRVFQRDTRTGGATGLGAGAVAITLTSSAAVSSTNLQYRLRDAAALTTTVGWTNAGVTSIASGSNAITLTLPGTATIQLLDLQLSDHAGYVTVPTTLGVGEVAFMVGQSLAAHAFAGNDTYESNTAPYVTNTLASLGLSLPSHKGFCWCPYLNQGATSTTLGSPTTYLGDYVDWETPADYTSGNPGTYNSSFVCEFLNRLTAATGVVCAVVGYAVGSTMIGSFDDSYYYGYSGHHSLCLQIPPVSGPVGKIGAWIWIQGHANSETGYVYQTGAPSYGALDLDYAAALKNMRSDMNAALQGPGGVAGGFPVLVCTIPGDYSSANGTDQNVSLIRAGALEFLAADSVGGIYVGGLDVTLEGDGTHPNQIGNIAFADEFYRAYMEATGMWSAAPGPSLTGATRASGSATIALAVQQNGGSALVTVGSAPQNQFTVWTSPTTYTSGDPSGEQWTVTALSIASATQINLTINTTGSKGTTLADTIALDVWYRLPLDTATIIANGIYDNVTNGDGLTTGRQLQLIATPLTAAAP
jgi:hypothetical protein